MVEPLTARELDVLKLLPTGLSRGEIASELSISANTVKSHTQAIYRKLGVGNQTELIEHVRALGADVPEATPGASEPGSIETGG